MEQIVAVLKQAELGMPVADIIRQVGVSEPSLCRWRKQYARLQSGQVRGPLRLESDEVPADLLARLPSAKSHHSPTTSETAEVGVSANPRPLLSNPGAGNGIRTRGTQPGKLSSQSDIIQHCQPLRRITFRAGSPITALDMTGADDVGTCAGARTRCVAVTLSASMPTGFRSTRARRIAMSQSKRRGEEGSSRQDPSPSSGARGRGRGLRRLPPQP